MVRREVFSSGPEPASPGTSQSSATRPLPAATEGKPQLKPGCSDKERWRQKRLALCNSNQETGVSSYQAAHLLNVIVEATDGKARVIVILPNPLRVLLDKKPVAVPALSPGCQGNPQTQPGAWPSSVLLASRAGGLTL